MHEVKDFNGVNEKNDQDRSISLISLIRIAVKHFPSYTLRETPFLNDDEVKATTGAMLCEAEKATSPDRDAPYALHLKS